jgi:hypothetical protein
MTAPSFPANQMCRACVAADQQGRQGAASVVATGRERRPAAASYARAARRAPPGPARGEARWTTRADAPER